MAAKTVEIHVGEGLAESDRRFVEAWHRAERGEAAGEVHLSFESWDALSRTLTRKRIELLRHLHNQPAASVAELARALGRDYKRVHEDVEALAAAGLIDAPTVCASITTRSGRGSQSDRAAATCPNP